MAPRDRRGRQLGPKPRERLGHGAQALRQALSKGSSINEVLQTGDTIRRLEVVNLGDRFPSAEVQGEKPCLCCQVVNSLRFPGEMAGRGWPKG